MNFKKISIIVALVLLFSICLGMGIVKANTIHAVSVFVENEDASGQVKLPSLGSMDSNTAELKSENSKIIYDFNLFKQEYSRYSVDGYKGAGLTIRVPATASEESFDATVTLPFPDGKYNRVIIKDFTGKTIQELKGSSSVTTTIKMQMSGEMAMYDALIYFGYIEPVEPKYIDTIKIVDATLDLKPGEEPKFTAVSAEEDLYTLKFSGASESWKDVTTKQYTMSNSWLLSREEDKTKIIDKFVGGHEYSYSLTIQAVGPDDDGMMACKFDENTKISVNGKVYKACESFDKYTISFDDILTVTADYRLDTDSSAAVETTITATKPLPENTTLSVKEVEVPAALKATETNLKKIYDISALSTVDGSVVEVKDNELTITVSLDKDLLGFDTYQAVYIDDNGKVAERFNATVANEKLTFVTSHLSNYGIIAYNKPVVDPNKKDETPKTGVNTIACISILAVVSLGSIVLINKKSRH